MRSELDALLSTQRFMAGVLPEPWDIRTDLETGESPERPYALVEMAGNAETSGAPVTQDIIIPITASLFLPKGDTRNGANLAALELREQVWQAVKWGPDPTRPTTDRIPLYSYTPRIEQHRFQLPPAVADQAFTITVATEVTGSLDISATAADIAVAIATALGTDPANLLGQDRGTGLWDVYYVGDLAGQRIGDPTMSVGNARTMLQGAAVPWRAPSDYMRVSSFSQNTVRDASDPTLVMVAVDVRLTFARGLPLPLDTRILQRVSATVGSGPGG